MIVPDPLRRVVPELADLPYGDEPLASCASCAMTPRPSDPDAVFSSPTRCCTYHPRLANFLAGSALRRGGNGADRVRARLADPDGLTPEGILAPQSRSRRWKGRAAEAFGRDVSFACPYWVEGPLGCSIHADRDAVCRTWHCKVVTGHRGHRAWTAANVLLASVERRLARWCADRVTWDLADPAGSYLAAVAALDAASDEELRSLRSPRLEALLDAAFARAEDRDRSLPPVVVPAVRDWERRAEGVSVTSFSPFDRVLLPTWIFELLSRLDGQRGWREAVDLTSEALGRPVPHDLVWHLWARGLVAAPEDLEGPDDPVVTGLPEE